MKCETCQELLSEFIDDQLDEKIIARVKAHLTLCLKCAEIYEDFSSILGVCDADLSEDVSLPNEQALWCRITNIIETETKPKPPPAPTAKAERHGWFAKMWRQTWSLSLTQLAAAIFAIALISSLLTVVGLRNIVPDGDAAANVLVQRSLFEKVLGKLGFVETPEQAREQRMREQRAAVDYWNKRVAARRAQWNNNVREAFDRNLNEIDQIVTGYNRVLEKNPQDELSNEMLDSAMSEKVELLREFSEL